MPTRKEIAQQQLAMKKALKAALRDGSLAPGSLLPPLRELAEQHQVSMYVAHQTLQSLRGEGLLHTVPRVGTYVGMPRPEHSEYYLLLLPPKAWSLTDENLHQQVRSGFENRIAQYGGASLVMPLEKALHARERGELPALAGVFDLAYQPGEGTLWKDIPTIPHVGMYDFVADQSHADTVAFDDIGGGMLATQHLLHMGHRRIAFLGIHAAAATERDQDWRYVVWSAEREQGWRKVMVEAGEYSEDLAFHPVKNPRLYFHRSEENFDSACELLKRPDITAVVAANDTIAGVIFEAARLSGLPEERWPAAVGFDDRPGSDEHVVTSLRQPGERVGHVAADLLWERRQGILTGPPQHRKVPMLLIPRLTSRMNWSQGTGHTALTTPHVQHHGAQRLKAKQGKFPRSAPVDAVTPTPRS